jgi:signal transduction histidine kinase
MADAARRITADTAGERLPEPGARGELQDLAGAFNGLLGRLEESLERQRRFAGEASHQLRTPLTAMLGQLEVALRRDRPPEEYRQALAKAAGQAGRLRRIVEMLLFLARADAEARLPDLSPLDLAAWLPGHLAEAWGGHPRFAEIRAEPGGGPVAVLAQAALLGQALDNLLDNALKHDPRGPVAVRVGLEGGLARIEVEDRGEGIAPGEAGRVFEPFFRSPEARRRGLPGIGLGLAVTARIVSAFGGRIEVESRPGHGSRFTIRLPLAPAAGLEGEPTGTAQEAGDG